MKVIKTLSPALGALTLIVAFTSAWSQTTVTASPATEPAAASTGVTPKASGQANRALRKKIYAAIAKHKEISAGTISVTVKGDAVTLNGSVSDGMQINKVAEIVKGVPGVTSVINKLTVERPFDQ
jgi:hyperosmotically inducible protein